LIFVEQKCNRTSAPLERVDIMLDVLVAHQKNFPGMCGHGLASLPPQKYEMLPLSSLKDVPGHSLLLLSLVDIR